MALSIAGPPKWAMWDTWSSYSPCTAVFPQGHVLFKSERQTKYIIAPENYGQIHNSANDE